jgi:Lumazine binding domain
VAKLTGNVVTVAIIPHTWKSTNLPFLNPGDPVNIERNVMSSHPAKWSAEERAGAPQGITPSASEKQFRYAVVVSELNSFITDQLLRGALHTLKSHRAALSDITVVHATRRRASLTAQIGSKSTSAKQ